MKFRYSIYPDTIFHSMIPRYIKVNRRDRIVKHLKVEEKWKKNVIQVVYKWNRIIIWLLLFILQDPMFDGFGNQT